MAPNSNSVTGAFHARISPSSTLNTKGHAPGTQTGPPESHVKLMPVGTAPPDRTFVPNPPSDANLPGATYEQISKETFVSARDSIVGATSEDVHNGLGHPGSGQPASEKDPHKERSGLEGRGATHGDWIKVSGLDRNQEKGGKLTSAEGRADILSAEDRLPVGQEELAAEMP